MYSKPTNTFLLYIIVEVYLLCAVVIEVEVVLIYIQNSQIADIDYFYWKRSFMGNVTHPWLLFSMSALHPNSDYTYTVSQSMSLSQYTQVAVMKVQIKSEARLYELSSRILYVMLYGISIIDKLPR